MKHALYFFILLLLLFCNHVVLSQQIITNTFQTNGPIYCQTIDSLTNTLYLGGDFTTVYNPGDVIGAYGAQLDSNGLVSNVMPQPNGAINSVISDGNGGWFIGGSFSKVGSLNKNNLAHITPDGLVNPYMPQFNGAINALAKKGDTLIVGGSFSNANNTGYAQYGVPINSNGEPQGNWPSPNGNVETAVPDGMGGWYIGGGFTMVGDSVRNRIAYINGNGIVSSWNPNANNTVRAFVLSGSTLFVGGDFTNIGNQSRNYIASLNTNTGLAKTWNPNADGSVYALTLNSFNIYVGGTFGNIGGNYRQYLAAIDTTSGFSTGWYPNPSSIVRTIAISGSSVFVGGSFNYMWGFSVNRQYIAALDITTGYPTSWNPGANSPVYCLTLNGQLLYVGGTFSFLGGLNRPFLGSIETSTGLTTTWNPNSNSSVNSISVTGNDVYVGGDFTIIGGKNRNYIASVNALSAVSNDWNPSPNSSVRIVSVSGNTIYAGGYFSSIGGGAYPRSNLAAVSISTGNILSWNPNANSSVSALAVDDNTIYAGGSFTNIGGQNRNYLAALDKNIGSATTWNPSPNSNVLSLLVNGNIIYTGGYFSFIGGQNRQYIAALDILTGNATGWNPSANGAIRTLAISGSRIFTGGEFSYIGGQSRSYLASIDTTSGNADNWNPNPNSTVYGISVLGNKLYAGGSFYAVSGSNRNYLTAIDLTSGLILSGWEANANSVVYCIAASGSMVYAGGGFTIIGGRTRNRLAAIDISSGMIKSWNPDANTTVWSLCTNSNSVFAGGNFTTIGNQSRNYISELDKITGLATTWNPNPNSTVISLFANGNTIYAGGYFNIISGQSRNYIAALEASTGNVTAWNPNANNVVRTIALNGNSLYIGGDFNYFGGFSYYRTYLASLDTTTGIPNSWSPNADNTVRCIAIGNNGVYVGGTFTNIGGQSRNRLALVDFSGNVNAWNPNSNSTIESIAINGTRVYVGGSFNNILSQTRNYLAGFNAITGLLLPAWNPNANNTVRTLVTKGSYLSTGGYFSTMTGINRNYFSKLPLFLNTEIVTGQIANVGFCPNQNILVPYTFVGTINAGNVFRAELSDSSGSFISPVVIGSIIANVQGAIAAQIPSNILAGNKYRIRVVSTNPVLTGTDNGGYLTFHASPNVNAIPVSPICEGGQINLNASSSSGNVRFNWSGPNGFIASSQNTIINNVSLANAGTYSVTTILEPYGCISSPVTTTVNVLKNPDISCNSTRLSSVGSNDGTASVIINSGNPSYTYNWNNGGTTATIINLPAGVYSVNVTDGNGCSSLCTVAVQNPVFPLTNTLPQFNGPVYCQYLDSANNTLYIGGSFSKVYDPGVLPGRYGVLLNDTGLVVGNLPLPNGTVNAAIEDGNGGWYIGGSFSSLGNTSRNNLAHISNSGIVDSSFIFQTNGSVNTLMKQNGNLYVGGAFSSVSNFNSNLQNFAVVDNVGFANIALPNFNGNVNAIISDGNGGWYIGGDFTMVGNTPRNYIARISSSGSLSTWNPNSNGPVFSLFLYGSNVYTGGAFTNIGGSYRQYLASIDTSNGVASSWNPGINGYVYTINAQNSNIYIGGNFTSVYGFYRQYLASIDSSTGIPTSWAPNPNGNVLTMTISGSIAYVGGTFTNITNQYRQFVAAIDINSGNPTGWIAYPNSYVYSIYVKNSNVYIGGDFSSVSGYNRQCIASLDINSGTPNNWNPGANSVVFSINSIGSTIYIGGNFYYVGGQPREKIAAIDEFTGTVTSWNLNLGGSYVKSIFVSNNSVAIGGTFYSINPTINNLFSINISTSKLNNWLPAPNGPVNALAYSNDLIFVGGNFNNVNNQNRNGLAVFDEPTGDLTFIDYNLNGNVYTLRHDNNVIYAGGSFTVASYQSRNYMASIDDFWATLTSWNPNANSPVRAITSNSNTVFAGGDFTSIGGQSRGYLASIDAATGSLNTWNPNANNTVRTLALNGNTLFAGGDFTTIGGENRSRLASMDATTAAINSWDPSPDNTVRVLTPSGNRIYAGGDFTTIGAGQNRNNIAAFYANTGKLKPWNPNASNTVRSITVGPSTVFASGNFTSIGGQSRNYIAELDSSIGNVTAWNAYADNAIYALAYGGNTLYAGGDFSQIGGQYRNRIASLDVTTGLSNPWNPNANSTILALALNGNNVIAGGSFNNIGTASRNYIAELNIFGLSTTWNPNANSTVRTLFINGSTIYAGGDFTNLNGQTLNRIAAIDASSGNPLSWNPDANGTVRSIMVKGSILFTGGDFTNIGGQPRNRIAVLNTATGSALSWNPNSNNNVHCLSVSNNVISAGGDFTYIDGKAREYFASILSSFDDNNACTYDSLIVSTGVIIHTAVNVDDNNLCTSDGCNTLTGVFHDPVNLDDNNLCTVDGCNSVTGISHVLINISDNNACTTDACDPLTGSINHIANINISNNDTTICKGATLNLIVEGDISRNQVCNLSGLPANLQNGLVAYYPFCANANDISGNGNNGMVNGATLTSDRFGNVSSAYSFNGINNWIEIPHNSNLNLTGDLTISAWVKSINPPLNNNAHTIIAKRDEGFSCCSSIVPWDLEINYNLPNDYKKIIFASSNGGYTFSQCDTLIINNVWFNATITISGSTYSFYINGILKQQINNSTPRVGNLSPVVIGAIKRAFGDEYMNGSLDDIGIWNRALTSSEVQELYSGTSYSWSTGETTQSINVTPTQSTTYYCTVTQDGQSCIDSVKVNVNLYYQGTVNASICQGSSYTLPNGQIVNSAGSYITTLQSLNGCDSVINTTLSIENFSSSIYNNSVAPSIQWQKSFGGSLREDASCVQQTTDGGYIIAGSSTSINGDVSGHHGSSTFNDYWIIKLNDAGTIQWQKSLGGSNYENLTSIQQCTDGGYIIAGSSSSNDGDVTGNHGGYDYWIVKLNDIGNIQWQKSLGGSLGDGASSIQQTFDGGYIVVGYSYSMDGDVTGNHGLYDTWVVKLTNSGNIQWQKSFGGSSGDYPCCIQQSLDGGYIIAVQSVSNDGDVTGNHGDGDCWVFKIDNLGIMQWQNSLGGSLYDYATAIQQTFDGGYILSGASRSDDGDVTGNHGGLDFWIVKLSDLGNIQWQKSLGGTSDESATSIQQTNDGGYEVAGYAFSNNGNITGNHGDWDYWILKLNNLGNLQWQKTLGGSGTDYAYSIRETIDDGYIVAGASDSNNGDVSGNHGDVDFWIVKLASVSNSSFTLCQGDSITLTASLGTSYLWSNGATTQNISTSVSGIYSVTVTNNNGCSSSASTSVIVMPRITYYADSDIDGYGVTSNTQNLCTPSGIYTAIVGNDCNDNNANIHPGVTEVLNGVDDDCNGSTDEGTQEKVDIKLFVQGFYRGGGQMQPVLLNNNLSIIPTDCDYITLELHESTSPYSLVATQSSLMKTDGTCEFLFPPSVFNQSFYLVIRHRNSLETWSSNPVLFNAATKNYDFSISAAQAFGDNLADLGDGNFAIYSGDVDQNGNINQTDFLSVEGSTQLFNSGYITDDLTGDGLIESSDFSLIENNLGKINTAPYPNVTISNQVWMSKNLDVDRYRNGDPIPKVTDPLLWTNLTTGAYCYYNNDSVTYAAIYGKLYNWYAVHDPRGLAPTGWHIPIEAEWNLLVKFIDSSADTTCICTQSATAGGALKEIGTLHWTNPNMGANNSSGFTGLPGGVIDEHGLFGDIGNRGYWWSNDQFNFPYTWVRWVHYINSGIIRTYGDKRDGISVRCIRD